VAIRSEPAVLMAAASSSLTQAINTALKALENASAAISMTASPARAGSELFSQSSMTATSKEILAKVQKFLNTALVIQVIDSNGFIG
jgi:hypothetical protein